MYALFFQLYQVVFTSDVHRNGPDTVLLGSFVMEIEGRLTVRHMWSGLIPNLQPLGDVLFSQNMSLLSGRL